MKQAKIVQDTVDEHIFIKIECKGRPTISLDISNDYAVRCLSVRADGNGILNARLDVKALASKCGKEPPWRE